MSVCACVYLTFRARTDVNRRIGGTAFQIICCTLEVIETFVQTVAQANQSFVHVQPMQVQKPVSIKATVNECKDAETDKDADRYTEEHTHTHTDTHTHLVRVCGAQP